MFVSTVMISRASEVGLQQKVHVDFSINENYSVCYFGFSSQTENLFTRRLNNVFFDNVNDINVLCLPNQWNAMLEEIT